MPRHLTPAENLADILRDGLIPAIGPRSELVSEERPLVHLFSRFEDLESAGWLEDSFEEDEALALFYIDVPAADGAWTEIDRTIDPARIHLVSEDFESIPSYAPLREMERTARSVTDPEGLKRLVHELVREIQEPDEDRIKDEILRRAEIAAPLLGWSSERFAAFRHELGLQTHLPGRKVEYLDPTPFGLTEEDVISPGPDENMGLVRSIAHGRYDAARAFASWDLPDPEPDSPEDALSLARMYCDKADMEATDPDEIFVRNGMDSAGLAACYDGDPVAWLAEEHQASLQDGRSGYADLLLEKIRIPCVILEYEVARHDIADGWHRTAAAIAIGAPVNAVIVPLPEPEPGEEPAP